MRLMKSVPIAVASMAFVVCVSCSGAVSTPGELAALARAEEYFGDISAPGAGNDKLWGLRELHVFGRDTRFGVMAGGKPEVAIRVDSPDTYDVTIPFWCAGITPEGDSVKRKGSVVVRAHRKSDGAGWEVLQSEFREQSPLSFWRQFFAYLGWVGLAGLLLTIAAALLSAMSGSEKTPHVISALATVFVCWYVASVTFGSTFAVVVLVTLGVVGAISRIAQLNAA